MHIRKATQADRADLWRIHQGVILQRNRLGDPAYRAAVQRQGFVLGLEGAEGFGALIDEAYLFLVAEENGRALGYIIADHRQKFRDDGDKTWFDAGLKDVHFNAPDSTTLSMVVVAPDASRSGAALALTREFDAELRRRGIRHLFSIIVATPVANRPALAYAASYGFKRIAAGKPKTLFGIENFSAALFYRSLAPV